MTQTLDLTLLKKPSFTEDQLRNSLGQVQSQSEAGPLFDFRMRLPRDWAASFFPDATPQLGAPPALLFQASPEHNREIEICVWCTLLAREMNPIDWLEAWLDVQGHVLVDGQNFASSYGVLGDALSHSGDRDTPGLRRALTVKDGNRLFLIEVSARRDEVSVAELMQNVFLVSASTFELLAPTKERFAEPFEEVTVGASAPLTMLVPQSWAATPQSETPPEGGALLLDNDGIGSIFIASMPGCDNSDMLEETLLGKVAATGLDIKAFDDTKVQVPNNFMSILARSTRALLGENEMIVMAARAETPEHSAAVLLVTPSEDTAADALAINRRAYEVLLDSLRPAT